MRREYTPRLGDIWLSRSRTAVEASRRRTAKNGAYDPQPTFVTDRSWVTRYARLPMPSTRKPSPPVIASARVLSYAFVEDIPHKGQTIYVAGKPLGQVPCLAVCVGLGGDIGAMLFHCSSEWEALGVSGITGRSTIAEIKERAEMTYPGVAARWIDINTGVHDALRFYDEQTGGLRCSFCGKRPFEVEGLIEGPKVAICRECVIAFYEGLQTSGDVGENA